MSAIRNLANTKEFRGIGSWLKRRADAGQISFIRTPDGERFVVMRPEQLAELESILTDPFFVEALEAGVSDAVRGRVRRMEQGMTLQHLAAGAIPVSESMVDVIEQGVTDVSAGRVSRLKKGQSLGDFHKAKLPLRSTVPKAKRV